MHNLHGKPIVTTFRVELYLPLCQIKFKKTRRLNAVQALPTVQLIWLFEQVFMQRETRERQVKLVGRVIKQQSCGQFRWQHRPCRRHYLFHHCFCVHCFLAFLHNNFNEANKCGENDCRQAVCDFDEECTEDCVWWWEETSLVETELLCAHNTLTHDRLVWACNDHQVRSPSFKRLMGSSVPQGSTLSRMVIFCWNSLQMCFVY